MNLGLFEDYGYRNLLPLTYLRACFELRCGRDRLIDKIERHFGTPAAALLARDALQGVIQQRFAAGQPASDSEAWCFVNARALVTADLQPPPPGVAWVVDNEVVAFGGVPGEPPPAAMRHRFLDADLAADWLDGMQAESPPPGIRLIRYPWELVLANGDELRRQFTAGGIVDGKIYAEAHVLAQENIHVAQGATVKPGAVLDAEDGPIHIDANVTIGSNAVIQGPCSIGAGTLVQPGAVIRHDTSIGPVCKVGGELEASILHGHSNKQHDGFLGHSYVGEWVNLGADTITSDLKNTYGTIRVHLNGLAVETGERFIGSIIGDHAKTGIGTILPTGCVLGVAANVFTGGPAPKFVPSFGWLAAGEGGGGGASLQPCRVEKVIEIARTVMGRRNVKLTEADAALLAHTAEAARQVESGGWV